MAKRRRGVDEFGSAGEVGFGAGLGRSLGISGARNGQAPRLPHLTPGEPFALEGFRLSSATTVQDGYVRLQTQTGQAPVTMDLYALSSPVMLPDGYAGGWDLQERLGRVDVPVWTSGKPLAQRVDVLLDRLDRGDVQYEWNLLERLGRPPGGTRPPSLKLIGPWLHKDLQWTLQLEPSADEDMWVWDAGQLVRAAATLTLTQDVTLDLADRVTGPGTAAKPQRKTTVRKGENLKDVAKRVFGNGRRAQDIARLNKIKDTTRKLAPGTSLRLPDA